MIKHIALFSLYIYSMASFACTNIPAGADNFCAEFRKTATCYCTSSGLPEGMCLNMNSLYERMVKVFGSLEKACQYQPYTSAQDCINNWTYYRAGCY